jgi:acetyltransferase-like isoleucine patch superfamily enzyme
MKLIKKILLPLWLIFQEIIFKKNWYWANCRAMINKRIILLANAPKCYQYTIVSGMGKLYFGDKCQLGFVLGGRYRNGSIEFQARYENSKIIVGNNVSTNNNVFVCAANYIEIGPHTLIGEAVTIIDHEAHGIAPELRGQIGEIGEVKIGKNVWVGNNVVILKNTIIGDNSIVAAGAVVSGHFPPNVIIGGVPAKVIRQL